MVDAIIGRQDDWLFVLLCFYQDLTEIMTFGLLDKIKYTTRIMQITRGVKVLILVIFQNRAKYLIL